MDSPKPIYFAEKEYYSFSNFSSFAIEWRGKLWPTSEHAYQGAKFVDDTIQEAIRNARSAQEAYRISHMHKEKMDPDFNTIKLDVMEDILRAKLSQHEYVRMQLLQSGNRELIKDFEDDAYWGSGVEGKGENHLGKLWMKIRDDLSQR